MFNLAVFISGRGTNLQSIIDAIERKELDAKIEVVISNNPDAYGIERAKKHNIQFAIVDHRGKAREQHEDEIINVLQNYKIDLIVLAGYIRVLTSSWFGKCKIPIINIHPALLPMFGGKGFYGEKVHQAVLESGVRVSGCTVHFVNEIPDGGPIILQKVVEINDDDTPETLAHRILEVEHQALPEAIKLLSTKKYVIEGKRVKFVSRE